MIKMEIKYLDLILVPLGILSMVGYHIWLIRQTIKNPMNTTIGVNAISRRFWVTSMMEDGTGRNGVLAVQTLRNNIMASTVLGSTAILLSSLIAVLMTNTGGGKSDWISDLGDKTKQAYSIKYFSLLLCFMVVFLFNLQSIRYYSHASVLVNLPFKTMYSDQLRRKLTVEYVAKTVNRGCYFWSMGLRGFYFSLPLFLWIFGPIPMILSCFLLIFLLRFLDANVGFGSAVGISNESENDEEQGAQNLSI